MKKMKRIICTLLFIVLLLNSDALIETVMADPPSQIKRITSISLSKNEVTAPETITVDVAYEKGIGFTNAKIYFCNGDFDKRAYAVLNDVGNGVLRGVISTEELDSGVYYFDRVYFDLYGEDGWMRQSENYINSSMPQEYMDEERSGYQSWYLPEETKYLSFVVHNGSNIVESPFVLRDVELTCQRYSVPTEIGIVADVESTAAQIVSVEAKLGSDKKICQLSKGMDGKFYGTLPIGLYDYTTYLILWELTAIDGAGNEVTYKERYEYGKNQILFPSNIRGKSITVSNNLFYTIDCWMGLPLSNAVETIKLNSPMRVQLNFLNCDYNFKTNDYEWKYDSVMSEELFDAFKEAGGIAIPVGYNFLWMFDSADLINDSRDVDLDLSFYDITEHRDTEDTAIEEFVGNRYAYVVKFADSGLLPGKATLQLWLNDQERSRLGTESLALYSYDSEKDVLTLLGTDTQIRQYASFEIENLEKCVLVGKEKAQVGDLNDDGKLTTDDLAILLKQIAHIEPIADVTVADVNGDKTVNAKDLTALARLLLSE